MQTELSNSSSIHSNALITLTRSQSEAFRTFFSVDSSDGYSTTLMEIFQRCLAYDVDEENPTINAADVSEKFFCIKQLMSFMKMLEPASNF